MATDSVENYRIGLVLNKPDGERVHLFSIVGEGARMTGPLGVLMGDSPIDFQGDQQRQSLNLNKKDSTQITFTKRGRHAREGGHPQMSLRMHLDARLRAFAGMTMLCQNVSIRVAN